MKRAPAIACFGTASDVGKSVVATALCRHFASQGVRVAPFKAQNMSNNSGVTPEGLEMGRAQIVQAEAARIPPQVQMNPILLKPTSDVGSQVVVMGRAVANQTASEYHRDKGPLFQTACRALDDLRAAHDLIVIEGAGSCAEVNLAAHDIVNFRIAEYADAPVILIADIHRGGVFAQIVGTLECLPPERREQIRGFIINRFRGDIRIFDDGVRWIEQKTGKKVFGVLPYFSHFAIEAEDSVVIEKPAVVTPETLKHPAVGVIRLPHISNFTDIAPLSAIPGLQVAFLETPQALSPFHAVILPGSKNTRHDLVWLKTVGWDAHLRRYADGGGHIFGLCGGYQLMGRHVHDPDGLEGSPGSTEGLDLLPVETVLKAPKITTITRFSWEGIEGLGYEIHMGQTVRNSGDALLTLMEQNNRPVSGEDGCRSEDGKIMGAYLHGFFDTPGIARRWLSGIGLGHITVNRLPGLMERDRAYDLLAAHFSTHIDTEAVRVLIQRR